MTDLTPITALGAAMARVETHGGLCLHENPDLALASVALRAGATPPSPFGLRLPAVGSWCAQDGLGAFWTGPDQWMITAPGQGDTDFAASLAPQAPGCSVTEQTDGWVAIDVTCERGDMIDTLLTKLVNLDVAALGPGAAARTGLHHMTVFLVRQGDAHLTVLGMRTLADSLWHALATTAQRLET